MPISISLSRYGYRGWEWTLTDTDTDEITSYRTDEYGKGLWKLVPTEINLSKAYDPVPSILWDWEHIKSRLDFDLPYRRGSAWAKIRRELGKENL